MLKTLIFEQKKTYQTVNDGVAHSKNPRKCAYHVTFDLDPDLEHTLDAGSPGDYRVQVWWRSGHLPVRRSDLRKSLQTDGRTDRRTDDGRLAIVLAHSWNELKTFLHLWRSVSKIHGKLFTRLCVTIFTVKSK